MILSIHTVFIWRENILFMDEWISYHISIGFQKFFLYDNSNTAGCEGARPGINRYGYNFNEITKHIPGDSLKEMAENLLKKFGDRITYINWEPRDAHGDIIYSQQSAIKDYILRFPGESDWTAFIDMDEFIYSRTPIHDLVEMCEINDITDLVLLQKKFDDRFNNLDIPVTHIVDCIEGIDTHNWGPKHLLKNIHFNLQETNYWNVHCLPTRNGIYKIGNINHLRFNHYNVNTAQLEWMKSFYHTASDFNLNAKCYDLYNQAIGL